MWVSQCSCWLWRIRTRALSLPLAAAAASASLSAIVRDYHGDGVPGPCHRLTPCLPCPALRQRAQSELYNRRNSVPLNFYLFPFSASISLLAAARLRARVR